MAKAKDRDGAAALHEWCLSRLADYNSAALRDPMATGVRQLALDLLDRSDADSASLDALVKRISDRALRDRAAQVRGRRVAPELRAEPRAERVVGIWRLVAHSLV